MNQISNPKGIPDESSRSDFALGDGDLNIGLGHGYGKNEDKWIVKAIVGIPIEKLLGRRRGRDST
jgi:hypothetical protein